MKKVSLLAAVSFIAAQGAIANTDGAAPAAVCPNGFKGFFLGGNVGLGTGAGKQKVTETVFASDNVYSVYGKPVGLRGVDGGINVGYNYVFGNKFGLGLEFVANWANSSGKVIATNPNLNNLNGRNSVMVERAKLANSLQLRANFSYVIANLVAPKIILGWDNSQWKQNFVSTEESATNRAFTFKKTHRYNGFLWGLGVDFLAMKHVILGVEYTGTIASGKKHTITDPATKNVYASSFKPQYNKIALTAKIIY
jgi:opacity protein-like surface antigen